MLLKDYTIHKVENYREFCLMFDLDFDEEYDDFDEELIKDALNTFENDYIVEFIDDRNDGYFIIIELFTNKGN